VSETAHFRGYRGDSVRWPAARVTNSRTVELGRHVDCSRTRC
jgi:hypothetical protein